MMRVINRKKVYTSCGALISFFCLVFYAIRISSLTQDRVVEVYSDNIETAPKDAQRLNNKVSTARESAADCPEDPLITATAVNSKILDGSLQEVHNSHPAQTGSLSRTLSSVSKSNNSSLSTSITPNSSNSLKKDKTNEITTNQQENFGVLSDSKNDKSETLRPKLTKVLLVTYYRGGSSFLGEIFNQYENGFYWFEPLKPLFEAGKYRDIKANSSLWPYKIEQDTNRLLNADFRTLNVDTIHHLLMCQLSFVMQDVVLHDFVDRSIKVKPYRKCLYKYRQQKLSNDKISEKCLPLLTEQCAASSLTAVKVIRLPLSVVEYVWDLDPDIYVIHYVRDPRGMMLSRDHINHYRNISRTARTACTAMANNLKLSKTLLQKYPEKFMELKYEQFAVDPINTVNEIYKFLRLSTPGSITKWLETNTHSKQNDTYSTTRNSEETASKWRKQITPEFKSKVDTACQTVLKDLKYKI